MIRDSVSSPRLLARSERIPDTARSCTLRVKGYETYRARAAFGVRSDSHRLLHRFQLNQPSPWRKSFASGPADRWVPLSSHPCLPSRRRNRVQQGPFAPRALPRLIATTGPAATVSPSAPFPVSPVIEPTLLHRFLDGARTASPVARHVLVTVLPLPPRRSDAPHQSDCDTLCCLRPDGAGSASGSSFLTRPPVGSLTLRPGDSLTIPRMALSIGFTGFVSSTDAIQATGLLTPAPVGLTPTEHASLRWTHSLPLTPSDGRSGPFSGATRPRTPNQ